MDATKRPYWLNDFLPSAKSVVLVLGSVAVTSLVFMTSRALRCGCHEQARLQSENEQLRHDEEITRPYTMAGVSLYTEQAVEHFSWLVRNGDRVGAVRMTKQRNP